MPLEDCLSMDQIAGTCEKERCPRRVVGVSGQKSPQHLGDRHGGNLPGEEDHVLYQVFPR